MSSSFDYKDWDSEISTSLTLLAAIIANNYEKLLTQQHMQHMIEVDNLTGANNMKAFLASSSALFKTNNVSDYVVIYFDVDRFTLFNEKSLKDVYNYLKNLTIDIGTNGKEETEKYVSIGDFVIHDVSAQNLLNDFKSNSFIKVLITLFALL